MGQAKEENFYGAIKKVSTMAHFTPKIRSNTGLQHNNFSKASSFLLQNALNAQRVNGLVKTAESMGLLDTSSERSGHGYLLYLDSSLLLQECHIQIDKDVSGWKKVKAIGYRWNSRLSHRFGKGNKNRERSSMQYLNKMGFLNQTFSFCVPGVLQSIWLQGVFYKLNLRPFDR